MFSSRRFLFTGITIGLVLPGGLFWLAFKLTTSTTGQPSLEKPWKRSPEVTRAEYMEARTEYWLQAMRDPITGKIPRNIRQQELAMAHKAPIRQRNIRGKKPFVVSAGPDNVGGRTRAIAFDRTDRSGDTLLAGGTVSGVYRSPNHGKSWVKVTPADQLHSVTSIVQDPTNPKVWYYSTGEAAGSGGIGEILPGDGIWKSVDGGFNWSQLEASRSANSHRFDNNLDVITRLAVNPVNGDLYAAAHSSIWRSQDGGQTFNSVLDTKETALIREGITEVIITSDGSAIYAGFTGFADASIEGVWTSASGDTGDWTRIAGGSVRPPGWPDQGVYRRLVFALEPVQEKQLYVLMVNGNFIDCQNEAKSEGSLFVYDTGTESWTDRTTNMPADGPCTRGNNPFAVQGGYNLAVAISPDDPSTVFVGGTNVWSSSTAFQDPNSSLHVGGFGSLFNYSFYANHHPDIHTIVFNPLKPGTFYTGSDGGIHQGDSISTLPQYTSLNQGYTTAQYYFVAIAPDAGDPRAIGGMQDNGTWLTRGSRNHENLAGGDGVSVGIARDPNPDNGLDEEVFVVGSQSGTMFRSDPRDNRLIQINPRQSDFSLFITLFHLDHVNNNLVYYAGGNRLFRNTNLYGATTRNWQELKGVEAALEDFESLMSITTSYSPYTPANNLYFSTRRGRVFRLKDPAGDDTSTLPVDISPPQSQDNLFMTGLAVDPTDDRVVLAVSANYGAPSIFYTENADSDTPDWQMIEGNLGLPSIRSASIVQTQEGRVLFAGTSVGLWSTANPDGENTIWEREAVNEIGAAVVSDIDQRPADNTMVIGTHGNGMFIAKLDPPGETQMVFPWISNNKGSFESILVINNLADEGIVLRLTATRGDGSSQTVTRTIPGLGFLEESADSLFPLLGSGSGYSVFVQAPHDNLRGRWVTNNLTALSGESPSQGVAIVLSDENEVPEERFGQKILFNLLPLTGGFTSAPVIVNTGEQPVNVQLKYIAADGTLLAEDTLVDLVPNRPFAQVANQLLTNTSSDVALIAESDGGPITGVSFVFNNEGETAIGNVTAIDGNKGRDQLMYPWVSNNTGTFASILVTNNLGDTDATVVFTATRGDGTTENAERVVPSGGFLRESTANLFPILGSGSGYAVQATSQSSTLQGAWITYNLAAASGQSPSLGVAVPFKADDKSVRVGQTLLFGFLPAKGDFLAGPVITNLGDQPANIVLNYYDENGDLFLQDKTSLVGILPGIPYPLVPSRQEADGRPNLSLIAASNGPPITGVAFIFNGVFNEPAIGNATAVSFQNPTPSPSPKKNR